MVAWKATSIVSKLICFFCQKSSTQSMVQVFPITINGPGFPHYNQWSGFSPLQSMVRVFPIHSHVPRNQNWSSQKILNKCKFWLKTNLRPKYFRKVRPRSFGPWNRRLGLRTAGRVNRSVYHQHDQVVFLSSCGLTKTGKRFSKALPIIWLIFTRGPTARSSWSEFTAAPPLSSSIEE